MSGREEDSLKMGEINLITLMLSGFKGSLVDHILNHRVILFSSVFFLVFLFISWRKEGLGLRRVFKLELEGFAPEIKGIYVLLYDRL